MCGITGFWSACRVGEGELAETSTRMADAIRHRGPDDTGVWTCADNGIALGHRRLAVLDLSPAGRQPMSSAGGRWVIVFNGEIYNHLALRRELQAEGTAPTWRGHSDTETLLATVTAWGLERALRECEGMFAFALWDREARTLSLARDRSGEKPMYYGWQGDTLLFGSELRALRAHPGFCGRIDRSALTLLLQRNYIPTPYSIFEGIHKLPPGTSVTIAAGDRSALPVAYWSLREVAAYGIANPFAGSDADAVEALDKALTGAVRAQMVADVPVGALLSGGIDSSLIAALAQRNARTPLRTFTIGFDVANYDESSYARDVAGYLGTDHTELRISGDDALRVIPQLHSIYDEPFADSSQIPTYMVMKLARQQVTVALSGDGGDELFGGYNRYVQLPAIWRRIGWMPRHARGLIGRTLAAVPREAIDKLAGPLARRLGVAQVGDKAHKLGARMQGVLGLQDLYRSMTDEWTDGPVPVLGGQKPRDLFGDTGNWQPRIDPVAAMMVADGLAYLPDDILVKVDRAAMSVSLETRAPFLDPHVIALAWSLPPSSKIQGRRTKSILRTLLAAYLPPQYFERPKMGFGVPLHEWLRGPLKDWAEDLLSEARLRREGFFDAPKVRAAWSAHLAGRSNGHRLWSVLMFQAWLQETDSK